MPSGAQNRNAAAARSHRDNEARALTPLRLSNLADDERAEAGRLLSSFFDGSLGDPDDAAEVLPDPGTLDGQTLGPPQVQRARRIAQAEHLFATGADDRAKMSALRLLIRIDGTQKPDHSRLRDEVWALIERCHDVTWPEQLQTPATSDDDLTCRKWRAELLRLRWLLLRAADDAAEYRRIGPPVLGVIIRPGDKTSDKIGRMSAISLYAQEMAAVALRQQATAPGASPSERAAAVTKAVSVLGLNYPSAELAEWAEKTLELTSTPEGGTIVLGADKGATP